ncbi:Protein transport protein SEC23 [Nosema bombycis CQ1]|uniref:Protein transport protein SEC23 n=1 Tax=Nosema bombycis (strain CQ1 / CVCC 102059) TaxID=578461 RepID=R0KMR5_NOSB1|nr:Protein transport protein SEC23 [Nosema bombycis CQ1]|eukprot:EOB11407.1 Protein transport protein SEC23 [Nosema bombycis CQ1]
MRKTMSIKNESYLSQGFNAKVIVKTSPNLKYNGVLGMGKSSSSGWRLGSIFPSTNLTFLLETSKDVTHQDFGYVQIVTQYQRSDRKLIVRVTTFARMFSETKEEVIDGFDQEAVAVFQARFLLMKKYEEVKDCERMIDKNF